MRDPKWPIGKATDTPHTDEAESEVAGHAFRKVGQAEQADEGYVRGDMVEQPTDDESDPEAEVEGHGARWPAMDDELVADEDDPDAGDTESMVRRG
jgi:hypothetical protein